MAVLQIRATEGSVTTTLWPLTTDIHHVMIIVPSSFSKEYFFYQYHFYFLEILLNNFELVFLEFKHINTFTIYIFHLLFCKHSVY